MNYLIFDTEQTYNYGFIVVNGNGEILHRCNLVLTNNFENRHLIGENTYKRKKPIYEADPDARFMGSGEGAEYIKTTLQKFNIEQIISHNISEDRRQLELLAQQTGVSFPEIPFYDSINLVKVLFPNNTQTALEAIISDISGIDVKQTHTALQDCDLLYHLIAPIIGFMPCFIQYKDIFAHDNDYEVTSNFFLHLNTIFPLPRPIEDIQTLLKMDDTAGNKKIVSNFLKRAATEFGLWVVEEYTKYGKNGNPLKTPGLRIDHSDNPDKQDDLLLIASLFTELNKIADIIIASCVKHQASQETNETINARFEAYKSTLDAEHIARAQQLEQKYKAREQALAEQERKFEEACAARIAAIDRTVANAIISKIGPIARGGLFNAEAKKVKTMVNNHDTQGLFDYFMK